MSLNVPDEIEEHIVLGICQNATLPLPKNISSIRFGDSLIEIGDDCFSQLPILTNIYFGTSIKTIGNRCFNFYEEEEYLTKAPTLKVHFHEVVPQYPSSAFNRYADEEGYEEYADWGYMRCDTRRIEYKVDFINSMK